MVLPVTRQNSRSRQKMPLKAKRWLAIALFAQTVNFVGACVVLYASQTIWLEVIPVKKEGSCPKLTDNDGAMVKRNWMDGATRQGSNLTSDLFLLGGFEEGSKLQFYVNGLFREKSRWLNCVGGEDTCGSNPEKVLLDYTYQVWTGTCMTKNCAVPEQASQRLVGAQTLGKSPGCAQWSKFILSETGSSAANVDLQPKEAFIKSILCQSAQAATVAVLFAIAGLGLAIGIATFVIIARFYQNKKDHEYDREMLISTYKLLSIISGIMVLFASVFFGVVVNNKTALFRDWLVLHYTDCPTEGPMDLDIELAGGFFAGLAGSLMCVVSVFIMNLNESWGGGNKI